MKKNDNDAVVMKKKRSAMLLDGEGMTAEKIIIRSGGEAVVLSYSRLDSTNRLPRPRATNHEQQTSRISRRRLLFELPYEFQH